MMHKCRNLFRFAAATALLLHTQSLRFSDRADRGDLFGTEHSNRASRHSALGNRHAPLPVNLGLNHGRCVVERL